MAVPLVEHKLKLLPDLPGCYEMFNYAGKIIYVGKSKDLKHRVRSYFKAQHYGKVGEMVSQVRNFKTFYVANDKEAFLQEITLIQKYRPYFNIQLKQGHMGYPYIKITHERNPRLTITSTPKNDGAYYFGPYPYVGAAEHTLSFLRRVYPLRRCHGHHHTPCLYYHMGQCLGSCFKTVPKFVYAKQIKRIKSFLNGHCEHTKKILRQKMLDAASVMDYEQAEQIKKLLIYIHDTVEKQRIISHDYTPRDIFSYYAENGWICIQVFYLRQARLMKRVRQFSPIISSPIDSMLSYIVQFYRNKQNFTPKEILVPKQLPHDVLREALHTPVSTPKRGQKRGLLLMAYHNAKIYLKTRFRLLELNDTQPRKATQQLSKSLGIPYAHHIEAFDIADIQGHENVAGCVVFSDGKPHKRQYRKFKLHTLHADENAGMHEVIYRRYSRLLKEHKPLPNLILMDGGTIQTNAALDVLHNRLHINIPVAGMVKDAKHRTNHLIKKENGYFTRVPLDPRGKPFLLITRIQLEIHRFSINYFRNLHNRRSLQSRLTTIQGVGERTRNKLLRHFGAIKNIANATVPQLESLGISKKVASNIKISLAPPAKRKTSL